MLKKLKFSTDDFYSIITSKKFIMVASPLLVISILLKKYKNYLSFEKGL